MNKKTKANSLEQSIASSKTDPLRKRIKGNLKAEQAKEEARLRRNARRRELYAQKKKEYKEQLGEAGKAAERVLDKLRKKGMKLEEDVVFIPERGDGSILPFTRKITHTVTIGETIFTIGNKYGVLPSDIKGWNDIRHEPNRQLPVGSKITIYQKVDTDPHPLTTEDPDTGHTKIHHIQKPLGTVLTGMHQSFQSEKKDQGQTQGNTQIHPPTVIHVVKGESPEEIAGKYGVTVYDIMKWNDMTSPSGMEVRTKLKIYPSSSYLKNKDTKHPPLTWVEQLQQDNQNLQDANTTILSEFNYWKADILRQNDELRKKLDEALLSASKAIGEADGLRQENKHLKEENGKHLSNIFKAQDQFGELQEARQQNARLLQQLLDAREENLQLLEGHDKVLGEISNAADAAKEQLAKLRVEVNADRQRLVEANQRLTNTNRELRAKLEGRRKDGLVECIPIYHTFKGEGLGYLAERYGVTVREILEWNQRRHESDFGHGALLVFYITGTKLGLHVTHTVVRGDTLTSIAEKYDVDVKDLRAWNAYRHDHPVTGIYVGNRIHIYDVFPPRDESAAEGEIMYLKGRLANYEYVIAQHQANLDEIGKLRKEKQDLQKKLDEHMDHLQCLSQDHERIKKELEQVKKELYGYRVHNEEVVGENLRLKDELEARNAVVASMPQRLIHMIKRGETAYSIATLHGVTVPELAQWNNMKSISDLVIYCKNVGQALTIWIRPEGKSAGADSEKQDMTVRLEAIKKELAAEKEAHFNLDRTVGKLQNELFQSRSQRDYYQKENQRLQQELLDALHHKVALQQRLSAIPGGSVEKFFHFTSNGEVPADVARQYGVSLSDILRWNNYDHIHDVGLGAYLVIYPKGTQLRLHCRHTVCRGETIDNIAKKYNVDPREILAWNHLVGVPHHIAALQPNYIISIYEVVSVVEQLQKRLQVVTDQRDNIAKERADLEKKVNQMLVDNSNLGHNNGIQRKEIEDLRIERSRLGNANNSLRDEISQLKNQVASFRHANENLTVSINSLRREKEEAPIVYQDVYGGIGYRLEIEHLQKENDDLRLKLQGAYRNNEQLRKSIDDQNHLLNQRWRETGNLQDSVAKWKHAADDRDKTIAVIRREYDALSEITNNLRKENIGLHGWVSNLSAQVQVLGETMKPDAAEAMRLAQLMDEAGQALTDGMALISILQEGKTNLKKKKNKDNIDTVKKEMSKVCAQLLIEMGKFQKVYEEPAQDEEDCSTCPDREICENRDKAKKLLPNCVNPRPCNECAEHDACQAKHDLEEAEPEEEEDEDISFGDGSVNLLNLIFAKRSPEKKIDTEDDLIHVDDLKKQRAEELRKQEKKEDPLDALGDFLKGFAAKGHNPKTEMFGLPPIVHHPFGQPNKDECDKCPLKDRCPERVKK